MKLFGLSNIIDIKTESQMNKLSSLIQLVSQN